MIMMKDFDVGSGRVVKKNRNGRKKNADDDDLYLRKLSQ